MWENCIRIEMEYALEMGVIQPFQVREKLEQKGLPVFEVERLANEILKKYA